MNKKIVGLLIIFSGLIILIAFAYFSFFYKNTPEPVVTQEQNNPGPSKQINADQSKDFAPGASEGEKTVISAKPQVSLTKEEMTQEDLKRMAGSFAERFGSYSNQSDYGNIRDLKLFMSSNMKEWADKYIQESIAKNTNSDIYYGITTKAVSKTVQLFDEDGGRSEVLVKTQRRESTGSTANAVNFYQNIIVSFVKEKSVWKVDSAYWQGK